MGLLDFGAKVILTYKADTADAKAKIRELSGAEKQLAAERLKQEESANKGIERQIKGIGLLAAGIGALVGSIALAKSGLDAYAKTSDEAARKVKGIEDSASNAMASVQASIGKTVVAMEPLIKSIADVVKLLGDAGAAGPLAMGALALAISGNPVIAALVLGASSGTDPADVIFNAQGYIAGKRAQQKKGMEGALAGVRGFDPNPVTWKDVSNAVTEGIGRITGRGLGVDAWSGGVKFRGGGKAGPGKWGDVAESPYTDWTDYGGSSGASQGAKADDKSRDMYGREADLSALIQSDYDQKLEAMAVSARELAAINAAGPTVLERLLGSHDEMSIYAAAFQGLSNTIQGTFDAIVVGTEPAGAALKRLAATGVMSIAKEMLAGSIHYGAKAAGAAASYNWVQAGWYATTAAKYLAGAAAVGAIAHGLGGGGSTGGGGGSGARPSAPGFASSIGPSGSGGSSNVTIVYGDQFADDSPRNRQRTAQKIVAKALGTSGGTYS